jgi:adenylosuccinate lyase
VWLFYGFLRRYEALKAATRGKPMDEATMLSFIDTLDVSASVKAELRAVTPHNFNGFFDIDRYESRRE